MFWSLFLEVFMKKNKLLLGAHISIAGGMEQAITRAESIGCTALQIFTKNNRQWNAHPLTTEEIETFKNRVSQSLIDKDHIFAHATYLINIGSSDKEIEKKSMHALDHELKRCHALSIPYLILHPGAYLNTTLSNCLEQIITNIRTLFNENPHNTTTLLLETMAGQGTSVGHTFEQLAYIIHQLPEHAGKIGICLDTCHIFAAGYDFRDKNSYESLWKHFDTIIGFSYLKAIHLNDSKTDLDSHVDRHEAIGKGKIGQEAFALLCNDKRFFNVPKILETPYTTLDDYAHNIKIIQGLLSNDTMSALGIK